METARGVAARAAMMIYQYFIDTLLFFSNSLPNEPQRYPIPNLIHLSRN